jgi:type II secretory pathway predicted ATPase ExeA
VIVATGNLLARLGTGEAARCEDRLLALVGTGTLVGAGRTVDSRLLIEASPEAKSRSIQVCNRNRQ